MFAACCTGKKHKSRNATAIGVAPTNVMPPTPIAPPITDEPPATSVVKVVPEGEATPPGKKPGASKISIKRMHTSPIQGGRPAAL